jgi:hypothetical protein
VLQLKQHLKRGQPHQSFVGLLRDQNAHLDTTCRRQVSATFGVISLAPKVS